MPKNTSDLYNGVYLALSKEARGPIDTLVDELLMGAVEKEKPLGRQAATELVLALFVNFENRGVGFEEVVSGNPSIG